MDQFEIFIQKEKFVKESVIFYPGLSKPELKMVLNEKINQAAADFKMLASNSNSTEKDFQNKIKIGLLRFSDIYLDLDTEDRERICTYFEELMTIVGLQSSGGHLNDFMYGFDPN